MVQLAYILLQFPLLLSYFSSYRIFLSKEYFSRKHLYNLTHKPNLSHMSHQYFLQLPQYDKPEKKFAFPLFLYHNVHGGLISATCCVQYLHPLPFLRNNLPYSMLKSSKPCAVWKVQHSICPKF